MSAGINMMVAVKLGHGNKITSSELWQCFNITISLSIFSDSILISSKSQRINNILKVLCTYCTAFTSKSVCQDMSMRWGCVMMLCMMAGPLSLSPHPLLISPWSGAWSAHLSHLSARQPTLPHITRLLITQTDITPGPDDLSQQEAAPAKLTLLRRNSPREERDEQHQY